MKVTKEMIKAIDAIQDSDKLDGETKLIAISEILWMAKNDSSGINSESLLNWMFTWRLAPSGYRFWCNVYDSL